MKSSLRLLSSQRLSNGQRLRIPTGQASVSKLSDEAFVFLRSISNKNDLALPIQRRGFSMAMPAPRNEHPFLESKSASMHFSRRPPVVDDEPLPRTIEDALRPSSRAIVITETRMPFAVFNVNKAWEGLCGYSYHESKGKSLGTLLKGPETDPLAVTSLLNQLLKGEESTCVLTNYKKSGRKFQNRLHIGPLHDDNGKITHYVGVLQEV